MCDIGKNIKQKRETLGISQNQFAKMAGISQPALSAIESGTKKPNIETVCMIASAFKCTVSELMGEEKENGLVLTEQQRRILDIFSQLNDSGKEFLMTQAEFAIHQDHFRQDVSVQSAK